MGGWPRCVMWRDMGCGGRPGTSERKPGTSEHPPAWPWRHAASSIHCLQALSCWHQTHLPTHSAPHHRPHPQRGAEDWFVERIEVAGKRVICGVQPRLGAPVAHVEVKHHVLDVGCARHVRLPAETQRAEVEWEVRAEVEQPVGGGVLRRLFHDLVHISTWK